MSATITFENGGKDLLNGTQTEVRREWPDTYAKRFVVGDTIDAYGQFERGGQKRIAQLKIKAVSYESPFWIVRFKVLKTPVVLVRG